MAELRDRWTSGDAYQRFMGRWSPFLAELFVPWVCAPAGSDWLDVGCGTGALSHTILALADPASVMGVDPSEAFVNFARQSVDDPRVQSGSGGNRSRVASELNLRAKQSPPQIGKVTKSEGGEPRVEFRVGSGQALPVQDGSFDVAAAGLVINFVPDPAAALAEMKRALRPGGQIGCYVWDYADGMRMVRVFFDAAIALDPAAAKVDEGRRFELCNPTALTKLFNEAGLQNVETRALEFTMQFRDFNDYWDPFKGSVGPAPAYLASLPPERQLELEREVHNRLPIKSDGSFRLAARAWAVKGQT